MESLDLKPFKKLDHDSTLLRLDWFGGITPNLDEPDNPLIDCYFTPFVGNTSGDQAKKKPTRDIRNQIRAGLSVGYLPSLFLGQYFRAGKRVPLSEWPAYETISFVLDTSNPFSVIDTYITELDLKPSFDLVAYKYKNSAENAGIKQLNGLILHTDKITTPEARMHLPVEFTVYMHEMELIRFYLTNSEHSCKKLFTGAFQDNRVFIDVFNAIHEKPWFNHETRTGRFVYRHGYKQADALTLGRILFEPDWLALKAAQKVYKQITIDRINYKNNWLGYPRTHFPFHGKTQLLIQGRRLKTKSGFLFLANRIIGCSASFPFKNLSCCDEIYRGGRPAPDDADVAFKGTRTAYGPAHSDLDIGESVSDQRPDSRASSLIAQIGERNFVDLKNVSLEYVKLRDCTHKSSKKISEYLDHLINASTGGATSGESNSVPQTITERNVTPSTVAPDLENFLKIVSGLKVLKTHWKIYTICIGNGFQGNNGEWYSYFPLESCRKRKSIYRQFSYMDKEKTIRRRFIAVMIEINDKYLYLFEAQRRLKDTPPSDNQSPYKENLPILLLYKMGYSQCLNQDFSEVLTRTVIKETWPNQDEITHFVRDHTVHGLGAQSIDEMTSRVLDLITRNTDLA